MVNSCGIVQPIQLLYCGRESDWSLLVNQLDYALALDKNQHLCKYYPILSFGHKLKQFKIITQNFVLIQQKNLIFSLKIKYFSVKLTLFFA